MNARLSLCALLLGASACLDTTPSGGFTTRFASPITGRPLAELFYGAYVDEGGHDYHCGPKYYDGHKGTDILLRNFQVQDSGVTVIAAAPGRVVGVRSNQPDRNIVNNPSVAWNYVAIEHGDGLTSYYGHLRRNSVLVSVDQVVATGTPLGLVGSSGNSSWPHLHFEVRAGGVAIDPWQGSCGSGPGLWADQLAYQDPVLVLDAGVADRVLDRAALLERPRDDNPVTGASGSVSVWAEIFNLPAGVLRSDVLRADQSLLERLEETRPLPSFSATFLLATLQVSPALPRGAYTVVMSRAASAAGPFTELARRTFTLTGAAALRRGGTGAPSSLRVLVPGVDGEAVRP